MRARETRARRKMRRETACPAAYTSRGLIQIQNERGKERGKEIGEERRCTGAGRQHLESSAATLCSNPAVPTLQSCGSSPLPPSPSIDLQFCIFFLFSNKSGWAPSLLHPGASGSPPTCPPLPPWRHSFLELHACITGTQPHWYLLLFSSSAQLAFA